MFEDKYANVKKYCKVIDHCHYKVNIEVLHRTYIIQDVVYLKKF